MAKFLFVILFIGGMSMSFSFINKSEGTGNGISVSDSSANPLVSYGEYLFRRDNCIKCHSFSQSNLPGIISLDGFGGKYPLTWLYNYLTIPQAMKPGSIKISLEHLENAALNKSIFLYEVSQKNTDDWWQLIREANKVKDVLAKDFIRLKGLPEILALIAFLNQIPPSEALQLKIAQWEKESNERGEQWKTMIEDPNNEIYKVIKAKGSVAKGKILFQENCTPCHGREGEGNSIGPDLTDNIWIHGGSDEAILTTIYFGKIEKGMRPWNNDFSTEQIGQIVAYIKSLDDKKRYIL